MNSPEQPGAVQVQDFPGGIVLPDNKAQSLQQPIRPGGLPPELWLPLQQHLGQPAITVVSEGDRVLKGQLLAAAQGPDSVPVHAPTSGLISAIAQRAVPHPSGMSDWCITLIPDGEDRWRERQPLPAYLELERDQLLARVHASGIAGLGGSGFATGRKLDSTRGHQIHQLILNGVECEPYITADQALMQERAEEILEGLALTAHLIEAKQCLIAIEDNKPAAIQAMQGALARHREDNSQLQRPTEIVVIPTKYPSGGEKQLIQMLTGQELPHGTLPADIGILCHNVATVAAIYRAVVHDEPLLSRIITLTGEALADPGNREALLGTPINYLLQQAGQDQAATRHLIMGGPMMGFELPSSQVPVVKTSNCLIAATVQEMPPAPPAQTCIRCGQCEQVCPMTLLPQQLLWFAQGSEHHKAEQHNLFDCIECGACAYVCPSHIPLVQHYRHSKGVLRKEQAEQASANRARERFEQRQARLEREKAEKEARRQARAEARKARQSETPAATGSPEQAPTSAEIAAPVDTQMLEQRREQAMAKREELLERLSAARDQALASTPQLERALAKHEQRLAALDQKLADARTPAQGQTP
ncbi:MAG: electron transport complex subunit RsxC [Halomonadaceae bacterium]|nr:MAG: electron transport complex subunit RsxC [Halomonadaceae bacterium]